LIATSARPISLTIYAPATATAMSLRFGERRQRCGYAQRKSWWIVRGNRGDYDHWERSGATGWSYADVLPYFKRNETFAEGEDTWRGGSGPMGVIVDARLVRFGTTGSMPQRPPATPSTPTSTAGRNSGSGDDGGGLEDA
jgi:choline dehydrogenase-like flavoprotein